MKLANNNHVSTSYFKSISSSTIAAVVSIVGGLWLAVYLTRSLGIEGYGLVSMAIAFTFAVGIFSSSLNSAIGRFLTSSLAIKDIVNAKIVFNSALLSSVVLAIILLPISVIVSFYSPQIFNVTTSINDIRVFSFFTIAESIIYSFSSVFSSSCYARERFDLLAFLQVLTIISRLAAIVILFVSLSTNIMFVGIGDFIAAVISLIISCIFWRIITPEVSLNFRLAQWGMFKKMFSMGIWVGVDSIGMLMVSRLNTIIIGRYAGIVSAGYYGLYANVENVIYVIGGAITNPVGPKLYSLHAQTQYQEFRIKLFRGIKISLLFLALIVACIMGFNTLIVKLWLGTGFDKVSQLILIGIPLIALSIAFLPYTTVLNIKDKTNRIAFSTILTGFGHLATCLFIFVSPWNYNISWFVISSAVWSYIKIFLLVVFSEKGKMSSLKILIRYSILYIFAFAIPLLMSQIVQHFMNIDTVSKVILSGIVLVLMWGVLSSWNLSPNDLEELVGRNMIFFRRFQAWKTNSFSKKTNSTYTLFYRLPTQYEILKSACLPWLFSRKINNKLNILVIGCSNGAEPYTLASILLKANPNVEVKILGLDISKTQILKGQEGVYTRDEIFQNYQMTQEFVDNTFDKLDFNTYRVKKLYKEPVTLLIGDIFDRNMMDNLGKWDLVSIQNVLIHMNDAKVKNVYESIVNLLDENAILLIDGIKLDLKIKLLKKSGFIPVDQKIYEIHEQNERRSSWGEAYVGLEPFNHNDPEKSYKYGTIYLKGRESL